MDRPPFHSTFNPLFSPKFENYELPTCFTQLPPQFQDDEVVIPHLLPQQDHLDNLLLPITPSPENDLMLVKTNENNVTKLKDRKKNNVDHRENELKRRSQMSSLHASLRDLLPEDYIRGKRAMSDHLDEAVNYIRHLQVDIQALKDKRDALKKGMCIKNSSKTEDREVKVTSNKLGVDITFSTICEGLPLSKVLQCLIEEGYDVVSCITHRVDDSKLLHCIQTQVEDGRIVSTDASKLQQILQDL